MMTYQLGTIDASEALIKDLYIDLKTKVNAWSQITSQTSQARMGYVGQHLVSVVTGFPGGKSGARGYDLILGNGDYGEIKTCYRVDQLGVCKNCGTVVSSLETNCSACGSDKIDRRNDSKWLIGLRNEQEFIKVIEPKKYYFVLFEFEDPENALNDNIVASIWEVDPLNKGFAYCMVDYYLNIRAKSPSKAPFDMWPHQIKFALTKPRLIYQSVIKGDGTINTIVFPTLNNARVEEPLSLEKYSAARTVTVTALQSVIERLTGNRPVFSKKKEYLLYLQKIREAQSISNDTLCDALSEAIYLPLIIPKKADIPLQIKKHFSDLQ